MTCRLIEYRPDRFSIIRQRGTPPPPLPRLNIVTGVATQESAISSRIIPLYSVAYVCIYAKCLFAHVRRTAIHKLVNVIAPRQWIKPRARLIRRTLPFDADYRARCITLHWLYIDSSLSLLLFLRPFMRHVDIYPGRRLSTRHLNGLNG